MNSKSFAWIGGINGRLIPSRLVLFSLAFVLLGAFMATATAQQFRIETAIYSADSSESVAENLTLFDGPMVYDFMFDDQQRSQVEQIAIYNANDDSFVLLDVPRRVRLDISRATIRQLLTSLQSTEAFQKEIEFLIAPSFAEEFDAAENSVELNSKRIVYKVQGEPVEDDQVWTSYLKFANAYAELGVTDPRKLPPFARLRLNRVLENHRIFPRQVELTLDLPDRSGFGQQRISATSKHVYMWTLSSQDRQRIASAQESMAKFGRTTLPDFRRLAQNSSEQKQGR